MKKALLLSFAFLSLAACSDDDNNTQVTTPISDGAILSPAIGGPTQPNQVYVDLSGENSVAVNRTAWELAFYSGSEYRVAINGSIKMAAKQTTSNDITQPVEIDNTVAVGVPNQGTGEIDGGNISYIDHPAGAITGTAIAEVSANDADNKVYLVNLGNAIPTAIPQIGSVNLYGEARGWKKIRVLRNGNGYTLQYADPAATTFQEITIAKDAAYNFKFFSLTTNSEVVVEPQKDQWDLNLTTFTNILSMGPQGSISYFYSDFVVSNNKGGVRVYEVLNSAGVTYDAFTVANVDNAKLTAEAAADQRVIGANWRNAGGQGGAIPSVKDDRFYVVKDTDGNIYKLKFIAMYNMAGERGYPTFQYELLQ
jgi:hypothetical protein